MKVIFLGTFIFRKYKHLEQRRGLKFLLPIRRDQWLVYGFCLIIFVGFSCSRALISIGVIGLIGGALVTTDLRKTLASYRTRPSFYINAVFFFVILLSGINSSDTQQWLTFLRIKVPFLLLPVAFCAYSFLDSTFFNKLLFAFAVIMFISAMCVMGNYLLHYSAITQSILSGSIIPVPFSHIRYTLLLVFSIFIFIWLWEQWRVTSLLLPVVILVVVIHVLPSRSGWLALYGGLLFYFVVHVYRSRRYLPATIMLACLVALPFILYQTIPSFHNKIGYMRYTTQQYQSGHIDDLSDAMRLSSWHTGLELIRRHPLAGTGAGDLLAQSKLVSMEHYPTIKNNDDRKMPHNEFIWICAATGIFGVLAYCIAFFYPLLSHLRTRNWLFGILYIIFLTSFITEYPLEEQIGSIFYLLFLLIFLAHFHSSTYD